jgi:hypothetical protein
MTHGQRLWALIDSAPTRNPFTGATTLDDVVRAFTETYDQHHGSVERAAARLGLNPESLGRGLCRARARGCQVPVFYEGNRDVA